MGEEGYLHIIGVGSIEDWEAGRSSLYYIEDRRGETCLPVFTTPERAKRYVSTNFNVPEACMAMLESVGAGNVEPLTEGRSIVMPVDSNSVAKAAAIVGAVYLIHAPRSAEQQEVLHFNK
jgi:hypothetical protein